MKREFLQGLQVEGVPLPKEVIDAIMAENGRDIEAVKARYADVEGVVEAWQEKYNQAVEAHRQELSDVVFGHNLEKAILAARGRNARAITALLDVDALKASKDQQTAVEQAVEQPLLPVPFQIRHEQLLQMADNGQTDQNAGNDQRLIKPGPEKGLPVAGYGAVDDTPAAQGEEHAEQGMAHIGCS